MDILQEKIRKLKNPSVVGFDVSAGQLPRSSGKRKEVRQRPMGVSAGNCWRG